ncbi:MAG: peptide chain release factor N(5)-glutamine methyltransferase, partial [Bauldia sp.]
AFAGTNGVGEPAGSNMTIGALRRAIAARLRRAFAEPGRAGAPDLDARLIVAQAAGLDPGEVALRDDEAVAAEAAAVAMAFALRRIAGEPVARILGHKEFHDLDFTLSPETLVPRPDTETLVDAALAAVERQWGRDAPILIADLGTGSGAILLALLTELPNARGLGTDVSMGAIVTARDNARRLGLTSRAAFAVGDWLEPVGSPVDVVVANPPYIESGTIARLEPEVRDHDPRRALDGGADGLAAIRAIVSALGRVLGGDGVGLIEIGAGQRQQVESLAAAAGFAIRFERDLAGIDRVAVLSQRQSFR